jgi:type VI secretion system protein ImpG
MTEHIEYFQDELSAMRGAVDTFSHAYPAAAAELRLSAGHSADPHVEQLLQSFVWLTSQLRCDLEQQRQEIPNHLLLNLYPNLLRSIPSMTVMQGNVLADGANYVNGYTLEKGRMFSTWSTQRRSTEGNEKRAVECRMQCCYDTPMWPLTIDDVALKSKNVFDFLDNRMDVNGVISIALSSYGTDPIYEYPMSTIRFFIADPQIRSTLHQLLSNNLCGIAIRHGDKVIELPDASIAWLGFEEKQNVLPQTLGTHNAYRLLLEYFYFPEKFYFFDVNGLDVSGITEEFELLLILNKADKLQGLQKNSLTTNSFPAINLFQTTFKPVQLDHSRYEYRVIADESQYGQSEVHSVTQVRLLSSDGKVRHAEPWLGGAAAENVMDSHLNNHVESVDASPLAYVNRLVPPITPGSQGCDTMISLYDKALSPAYAIDQTLSTKGLCNNRQLPESLRIGNTLKLLGAGAMVNANIVSRPTLFKGAELNNESTVKLLSQLQLNQLSLVGSASGGELGRKEQGASLASQKISLERLKQLLHLYCDPMTASHRRQIDGITEISTKASVRRMGNDAWRGHYRGTIVTLTIEESFFDGANPLLFGDIISHFLGLYTTLNHFVQLQFISYQREGVWKQWPPRIGEQIIL